MKSLLVAAAFACSLSPVYADEISDTLQSALDAYTDGDVAYALEELEYARQQMMALKQDALTQFLPEAPEGYTREVNTEMNAGLALMGGGYGAEASYIAESGDSFTIQLLADNPMIAGLGALISNAAAYGAKIERVGRQKFMVQDGEAQALMNGRILIKAEGGDMATMLALLETIDYGALGAFGN
ncbi:hypothetical protein [Pseudooceanicola nanhaiensis]|uniref:hypothetical protein n=1 Tax=Pseudooceanicola nanhaiensis TaxID=375761 RepID=UPI001CD2ADA6|nr:hypothetical protein [Pseudooceanicola nanhaiensis]MCA0920518.1 hypothetical protein [Pseudooceanicola nanhaiensis]